MIIDTRTLEGMTTSLAAYYNTSVDAINCFIHLASIRAHESNVCFNTDIFEKELMNYLSRLHPTETIDEIYVYHLTRRLVSDNEDFSSDNLKSLLLRKSAISDFLNKHAVSFSLYNNHPVLIYKGKEIELVDEFNNDVCYLRSRLGYNYGREDYCFNGFAFRDLLMKNSYTRDLYYCPEFIRILSHFLKNKEIQKDYFENSKYYCLTYKLKITDILFDDNDSLTDDKKFVYYITKICKRILEYLTEPSFLHDISNPIIRVEDNACISSNNCVFKEEISLEMIE